MNSELVSHNLNYHGGVNIGAVEIIAAIAEVVFVVVRLELCETLTPERLPIARVHRHCFCSSLLTCFSCLSFGQY